jgi:anthranilate phosphoribosyltransferase
MSMTIEHPFAQYVRILGKGKTGSRSLNRDEAKTAMTMILNGDVEDVQLGAFLMLLRVKEESPEELAGFVDAVRANIQAPTMTVDLDWASYAGKRRQQAWYLLAALALADSGLNVVMHGAAGHTAERVYSELLLKELGETIAHDWSSAQAALNSRKFVYLPLSFLCPRLHHMMEMRQLFGLRSPVHTLSRLINPLAASYSMQSIFHPAYADSHQQAAALLGQKNAVVFKGEAGEVERKPEGLCKVKTIRNGELGEESWPKMLEGRQEWQSNLSADTLRRAWCGESVPEYGQLAIWGTMAIALQMRAPFLDQSSALSLAKDIWQQRNQNRLS